jgi:hypothetical protein
MLFVIEKVEVVDRNLLFPLTQLHKLDNPMDNNKMGHQDQLDFANSSVEQMVISNNIFVPHSFLSLHHLLDNNQNEQHQKVDHIVVCMYKTPNTTLRQLSLRISASFD